MLSIEVCHDDVILFPPRNQPARACSCHGVELGGSTEARRVQSTQTTDSALSTQSPLMSASTISPDAYFEVRLLLITRSFWRHYYPSSPISDRNQTTTSLRSRLWCLWMIGLARLLCNWQHQVPQVLTFRRFPRWNRTLPATARSRPCHYRCRCMPVCHPYSISVLTTLYLMTTLSSLRLRNARLRWTRSDGEAHVLVRCPCCLSLLLWCCC